MIIDCDDGFKGKVKLLLDNHVDTVGRYYCTENTYKLIDKTEARQISKAGIRLFTVYEDTGKSSQMVLTKERGQKDAAKAVEQAGVIGQPQGSAIYFAVEGLPDGYKKADLPKLRNYFSGVKETIGDKYAVGVYGDGVVCEALLNEGYCKYTWLPAASYKHPGTLAFFASGRWSLAQVAPLDIKPGWEGRKIDIDCANGDFGSFLVPVS